MSTWARSKKLQAILIMFIITDTIKESINFVSVLMPVYTEEAEAVNGYTVAFGEPMIPETVLDTIPSVKEQIEAYRDVQVNVTYSVAGRFGTRAHAVHTTTWALSC